MAEGSPELTPLAANDGVSRNLNGQKLGRKGKETRARIIAAATELVSQDNGTPVTLSAVARKVPLGMTSLYLYFNDLTELLIAVLEPVIAAAEDAYVAQLRQRWPDEELAGRCRDFVAAYHAYWLSHSRLLHLRNSMADLHDERMMQLRVAAAIPIIHLLVRQMDGDATATRSPPYAMASMLITGLERAATVLTDKALHRMFDDPAFNDIERFMRPAARLLELGIRDGREMVKNAG